MHLSLAYWRYDELTQILHEMAERYPHLARLVSIGQSLQGREIWALEITDFATGAPESKPAMYVDGNIHGSEPTGCAVAMYTCWQCLTGYGQDDAITQLLKERALYVVPRVNPDGTEDYLTLPERHFGGVLTHTMRPYPVDEEGAALYPEDVDGDGLVMQMRVPDPLGEWKASAHDDRLLLRRRPGDTEGPFYRLYPEGTIRNYDGSPFETRVGKFRLNLNRNFPAHWVPEWKQPMSGPYPLSEPESRAVVEYILARPNITVAQSYHTHSGLILRPLATRGDEGFPPEDLRWFQELGQIGEEVTGYPCVSTYTGFTPDKLLRAPRQGTFLDWAYEQVGILAFSTELWDPDGQAGNPCSLFMEQTEEQQLKALTWNDETLQGEGFVPWRTFEHPQLGTVEIGGWKREWTGRNAPLAFLEEECRKNHEHTVKLLASTAMLAIRNAQVTPLGDGLFEVSALVANAGFLPTYGSLVGKNSGIGAAPTVALEAEGALEILAGPAGPVSDLVKGQSLDAATGIRRVRQPISHLQGYGSQRAGYFYSAPPAREQAVRWLVRVPESVGGAPTVLLIASCPRAGEATCELRLEA